MVPPTQHPPAQRGVAAALSQLWMLSATCTSRLEGSITIYAMIALRAAIAPGPSNRRIECIQIRNDPASHSYERTRDRILRPEQIDWPCETR